MRRTIGSNHTVLRIERGTLACFAGIALLLLSGCSSSPKQPPYTPEEALKTFQIQDNFQIQIFASEPDIVDPVSMDIDEYGRIYVAESSGYPLDTETGAGRIKLLQDTDHDGKPDKTTLFANNLTMPTGVMVWKKGILVSDSPKVIYFEDTDGDGKADIRETMLEGFAFTNPQHMVNSPVYGLDNWIYLPHEGYARAVVFSDKFGDVGSDIHFTAKPDGPKLPIQRRSVRFRPDTFELEYLASGSQYGQGYDPWGQIFSNNNSNHGQHQVIAARYYERNPALRVAQPWQDISDHGNATAVFPITVNPRFELLTDAGQLTSGCSLTRYLGGAFPPGFENAAFVGEPAHNLVHADFWSDKDSTFVAKRIYEGKEFLASTDSWFRPVFFYVGPDGALYLLDYYRQVIEHPEWTSAETYESEDIYHGKNMGRIYRIVPKEGLPVFKNIGLGDASDEELAKQLESPNIWWRRTSQRLLVTRGHDTAVPVLTKMATDDESALARLHALWTLEGLGKLDTAVIEKALDDREAGVRRNAIILAEKRLSAQPALTKKLLTMGGDSDAKVRLQLVLTLGYVDSPTALALRDKLLFDGIEDRWMQVAALSWPAAQAGSLFTKATGPQGLTSTETEMREEFFRQIAAVIGVTGDTAGQRRLLAAAGDTHAGTEWWHIALLKGLASGLRSGDKKTVQPEIYTGLLRMFETGDEPLRQAALGVLQSVPPAPSDRTFQAAVVKARQTAGDAAADPQKRADGLALMALGDNTPQLQMLEGLIGSQQPEPVQVAAAKALAKVDGDEPPKFVLAHWKGMTGPVRSEAAEVFFRHDNDKATLVKALEDGSIQPWMLASRQRHRLMMEQDAALREHARKLLTEPEHGRKPVVDRYQAALGQDGDAARGKQVFERVCSKCHRLAGIGKEVGPDLATVQGRPAPLLLADILIPNKSIAQTFESYVIETNEGRVIDGVIGPQSPTFVTLRRENGEEDVVQRKDIKSMRATNLSAMPGDLEAQVNEREMNDLIQYIKTAKQ